mgnify:CR=1 FL=1
MTAPDSHAQHASPFDEPPGADAERREPAPGPAPPATVREPTPQAAPAAAPGRSARPAWWAVGGFLAGIVFWHLVGFWSFVSEIVFNQDEAASRFAAIEPLVLPPPSQPRQAAAARGAATPAGGDAGSAPAALSANCSALILDRNTGAVRLGPCRPSAQRLVDAGLRGRQDLAVADLIERRLSARLGIDPSRIETGSITARD